jgi:hypothetical protein
MYLLVTKYEDTVKNTVIRISMPIKKSGLQPFSTTIPAIRQVLGCNLFLYTYPPLSQVARINYVLKTQALSCIDIEIRTFSVSQGN